MRLLFNGHHDHCAFSVPVTTTLAGTNCPFPEGTFVVTYSQGNGVENQCSNDASSVVNVQGTTIQITACGGTNTYGMIEIVIPRLSRLTLTHSSILFSNVMQAIFCAKCTCVRLCVRVRASVYVCACVSSSVRVCVCTRVRVCVCVILATVNVFHVFLLSLYQHFLGM